MTENPFYQESSLLKKVWESHPKEFLRQYLVTGFRDPRIHVQSILTHEATYFGLSRCARVRGPILISGQILISSEKEVGIFDENICDFAATEQ